MMTALRPGIATKCTLHGLRQTCPRTRSSCAQKSKRDIGAAQWRAGPLPVMPISGRSFSGNSASTERLLVANFGSRILEASLGGSAGHRAVDPLFHLHLALVLLRER